MKKRPYRRIDSGTVHIIRQIVIGLLVLSFFVGIIWAVWFVTRIDSLTISEVTVSGGETIEHSQIEAIVREKISGTYFGLVPRSFAFTYPHTDVTEALKEIDRLSEVRVVKTGGTGLAIDFDEYIPHALWCTKVDTDRCFFIDEHGYSFAPSPVLTGGSFLRINTIGKEPSEDIQAVAEVDFHTVNELTNLFAQSGWYVKTAEVDGAGDVYFTLVEGGEFKVSLKQPALETMDNLLTVLRSESFSHITPGNFEYIDLRFGNKVFVNEETIQATSTKEATPPVEIEIVAPVEVVEVPPVVTEVASEESEVMEPE